MHQERSGSWTRAPQKPWRTEDMGMTYSKYWKKLLLTKDSVSDKIWFKNEGEIETFQVNRNSEFITASKPVPQEILKGVT